MRKLTAGLSLALLLCLTSHNTVQGQPKGPQVDAEARATFEKCLAKLAGLKSYAVRFQQLANTPGLKTTSEGRLLIGPERQVRFELASRHGAVQASTTLICDGKTIWRIDDVGGDKPEAVSYTLAEMESEIANLEAGKGNLDFDKLKELKKDLEYQHGFRGVLPALEDLAAKVTWTSRGEGTVERLGVERPAWVLEGEWSKDVRAAFIPPKQDAPPPQPTKPGQPAATRPAPVDPAELYDKRQAFLYFPRRAKLYLDKETLLPLRLEWWGPTQREGQNQLLTQLDWFDFKPTTGSEIAGPFGLTADERKLEIKPLDFKASLKRQVDFLVRQRQRERELQNARQDRGGP